MTKGAQYTQAATIKESKKTSESDMDDLFPILEYAPTAKAISEIIGALTALIHDLGHSNKISIHFV